MLIYNNLIVFYAKSERVNFGSKIGAVLAAAGSAVGLGNIWRFPYETGNHGGAAFIWYTWRVFLCWECLL